MAEDMLYEGLKNVDELHLAANHAIQNLKAAGESYYMTSTAVAAKDYLNKASRVLSLLEIYSELEPDNNYIKSLVDYYIHFLMDALRRNRVACANH